MNKITLDSLLEMGQSRSGKILLAEFLVMKMKSKEEFVIVMSCIKERLEWLII